MPLLQDEAGVAVTDVYVEIYFDEYCKQCGCNASDALGAPLGMLVVNQHWKSDKWGLVCRNCGLRDRDIGLKELLAIIPQLQACEKEFKSETKRRTSDA